MSIRISALLGLNLALLIAGCQLVERSLESKPRGHETTLSPAGETTAATPAPSPEGTGTARETPGTQEETQAETGAAGSAEETGAGAGGTVPEEGPTSAEEGGEMAATTAPGGPPTSLPVVITAGRKDLLAEATPALDPQAEAAEKEARALEFLARHRFDALFLKRPQSFAWLTAGGSNRVVQTSEEGCAGLLLLRTGKKYLLAPNHEIDRLSTEELTGLGYAPKTFKWYKTYTENAEEALLRALTKGLDVAADVYYPGTQFVGEEIKALMATLSDAEMEKYRWLGVQTAQAVGEVCQELEPGDTEDDLAARVSEKLLAKEITPTVLLVAADGRVGEHRHPLARGNPVKRQALISVGAQRWGLVVALTRAVYFGAALPAELRKQQDANAFIYATLLAETRPGQMLGSILDAARAAYATQGYPDEWERHHPGGTIGYWERHDLAYPDSVVRLQANQAVAWNPTLGRTKIEETLLIHEDRLEWITPAADDWPRRKVQVAGRTYVVPDILVKKSP